MYKGYRKTLEETDLWKPSPRHVTSSTMPLLETAWKKEIAQCRRFVSLNLKFTYLLFYLAEFNWTFIKKHYGKYVEKVVHVVIHFFYRKTLLYSVSQKIPPLQFSDIFSQTDGNF